MTYLRGLTLEEKVNSLFQPDQLLSIQFFETFRRRTSLEPERALMLAVLEDAVECLQKYARCNGNRLFRESIDWILADNDGWLFSFKNVCEAVGLNADYVRRGLIRMVEVERDKPQQPEPGEAQTSARQLPSVCPRGAACVENPHREKRSGI